MRNRFERQRRSNTGQWSGGSVLVSESGTIETARPRGRANFGRYVFFFLFFDAFFFFEGEAIDAFFFDVFRSGL
jgi:hypothetical protein